MAHAYRSLEDGQIVVSEEPRPDLEELARWESIPVPDEPTAPPVPSEDWTHAQLDELAKERGIEFPTNTNKANKVTALTSE